MKKYFAATAALLALSSCAFASDPLKDFEAYATVDSLKPLARDLGGMLGSGLYNTGRSLGFSGFDIGMRGAVQFRPSGGNAVMKKSGVKDFYLPWAQAELGMPYRIDGFIRGFSYQGFTFAGGGLKWGLLPIKDVPYAMQAMVVVAGHAATHKYVSIVHANAGLVLSMRLSQKLTPFIAAGADHTRLNVTGVSSSSPVFDQSVKVWDYRATAGFNFRPWSYAYISGAFNYLHGQPGAEASLGLRF